jgi:hypothetical protein
MVHLWDANKAWYVFRVSRFLPFVCFSFLWIDLNKPKSPRSSDHATRPEWGRSSITMSALVPASAMTREIHDWCAHQGWKRSVLHAWIFFADC